MKRFRRLLKILPLWQQGVAVLVFFVGTAYAVDQHYAKQTDLTAMAESAQMSQLKSDWRALRQEWVQLMSIPDRERRRRTSFEESRLSEITREMADIEEQIKALRKR